MAPCAHSEIVVGRRSIWCPSGPTGAVAGVEGAAVVGGVTDLLQPATISRQLATRTGELDVMSIPIAPTRNSVYLRATAGPTNAGKSGPTSSVTVLYAYRVRSLDKTHGLAFRPAETCRSPTAGPGSKTASRTENSVSGRWCPGDDLVRCNQSALHIRAVIRHLLGSTQAHRYLNSERGQCSRTWFRCRLLIEGRECVFPAASLPDDLETALGQQALIGCGRLNKASLRN